VLCMCQQVDVVRALRATRVVSYDGKKFPTVMSSEASNGGVVDGVTRVVKFAVVQRWQCYILLITSSQV